MTILTAIEKSKEGPSQALQKGLRAGMEMSKGSKMSHILVPNVEPAGDGWVVRANVALEPFAEDELPPQKRRKKSKGPEEEFIPEEDEEEEQHKKNREKRLEEIHQQEERMRIALENRREIEHNTVMAAEEFQLEALVHIYLQPAIESYFQPISQEFVEDENVTIHTVPDGPLWDEANRHFPDFDLHQAAHGVQQSKQAAKASPELHLSLDRLRSLNKKPKLER